MTDRRRCSAVADAKDFLPSIPIFTLDHPTSRLVVLSLSAQASIDQMRLLKRNGLAAKGKCVAMHGGCVLA